MAPKTCSLSLLMGLSVSENNTFRAHLVPHWTALKMSPHPFHVFCFCSPSACKSAAEGEQKPFQLKSIVIETAWAAGQSLCLLCQKQPLGQSQQAECVNVCIHLCVFVCSHPHTVQIRQRGRWTLSQHPGFGSWLLTPRDWEKLCCL